MAVSGGAFSSAHSGSTSSTSEWASGSSSRRFDRWIGCRFRRVRGLSPRGRVDTTAIELGRALQDLPQSSPHFGPLAEPFGDDVPHTGQHIVDGTEFLLRRDQAGSSGRQIGGSGVRVEYFAGQRFQAALTGRGGQRLLLGLVGQIEVFQAFAGSGRPNLFEQLRSHDPLGLDRFENGLLAFGQRAQFPHFLLNAADLLFIQGPCLVFSEASDERNRVTVIQKHHRILNAFQGQTHIHARLDPDRFRS